MEKQEEKVEVTSTVTETVKESASKTEPTAATSAPSSLNGSFPAELNKWNWGAFFLTWIWSIGNSTWIGLLALISPIGLIMSIILGIKGNEWAWNNRKFENVEQFKAVQRKWALWGLILFLIFTILGITLMTLTIKSGVDVARENANQAAINANSFSQEQIDEEAAINANSYTQDQVMEENPQIDPNQTAE